MLLYLSIRVEAYCATAVTQPVPHVTHPPRSLCTTRFQPHSTSLPQGHFPNWENNRAITGLHCCCILNSHLCCELLNLALDCEVAVQCKIKHVRRKQRTNFLGSENDLMTQLWMSGMKKTLAADNYQLHQATGSSTCSFCTAYHVLLFQMSVH